MRALAPMFRCGERGTVKVARSSQALAIAVTDRWARTEAGRPRVWGKLVAAQLDLAKLVAIEPGRVVDEGYAHTQRLLSLHREFAQRLFEAGDVRDDTPADSESSAIIPMMQGRGGRN